MAAAKNLLAPAVFVTGLALACLGVALVYTPAGLISGGGVMAVVAFAYVRGAPAAEKATPDA